MSLADTPRLPAPRRIARQMAASYTELPQTTPLPRLRDALRFLEGFGDIGAGKLLRQVEDILDGAAPVS